MVALRARPSTPAVFLSAVSLGCYARVMKCTRSKAWFALFGVLWACDDGEVKPSERERSCKAICDKLELCNDATDVLGCTEHCEAQEFRSDAYFRARASCVSELACNHLLSEIGTQGEDLCAEDCMVADCVDDALAGEEHTSEQTALCTRTSSKLAACDRELDDLTVTDECMRVVSSMSDDYMDESSACVDLPCARIQGCLDDAADRYDTTLRIYGGKVE